MEQIDVKNTSRIFPRFPYKRIPVNAQTAQFSFQLDKTYGYFIRRLYVKYPFKTLVTDVEEVLSFYSVGPVVRLEITDVGNNKKLDSTPYPVELIATPGSHNAYQAAAPDPFNGDGYNLNNSATPPKYSIIQNQLMAYGDILWLTFSGMEYQTTARDPDSGTEYSIIPVWNPGYIDVLVCGYYVPEPSFISMQGGR